MQFYNFTEEYGLNPVMLTVACLHTSSWLRKCSYC